jgi:hypothetical protein
MAIIAKVGLSRDPDAQQAGSDAAAQALVELEGLTYGCRSSTTVLN